jgi:hypothetical protein
VLRMADEGQMRVEDEGDVHERGRLIIRARPWSTR